ncbi:uncharacterized protein LOC119392894 [Rhipicephalus sanguineus]|uniref:uncharacterized protein LOC119392894 n=1 Tax=Rhipicephalus sanguineus TaxID=34632 RepID=UPI0018956EDB|nr:uncharacterized protein LOC119392894 [Rhipicephalus sanguineus]
MAARSCLEANVITWVDTSTDMDPPKLTVVHVGAGDVVGVYEAEAKDAAAIEGGITAAGARLHKVMKGPDKETAKGLRNDAGKDPWGDRVKGLRKGQTEDQVKDKAKGQDKVKDKANDKARDAERKKESDREAV